MTVSLFRGCLPAESSCRGAFCTDVRNAVSIARATARLLITQQSRAVDRVLSS